MTQASPDKHHIHLVCCGTHRSLQNNTVYSSPLLWYSHVSLTIKHHTLSLSYTAQRFSQTNSIPLFCCTNKQGSLTSETVQPTPAQIGSGYSAALMCMLHESLACVWSVITTKEWHGRPVDTNASVSSLASLHAVMHGATGCLFGQLVYTAFIPFRLLNLKLRELIIAYNTLSHNTFHVVVRQGMRVLHRQLSRGFFHTASTKLSLWLLVKTLLLHNTLGTAFHYVKCKVNFILR